MLDDDSLRFAYPPLRNLVSIYEEAGWYWISGITFREFMLAAERPIRLLLLRHGFYAGETEFLHTRLEYVDEDLPALIADGPMKYGDFWWIDFNSREHLAELPQQEFLELLYMKQLAKPLASPCFPALQNRFAYFGHDDGWALHLWVDQRERLARILAHVLTVKYVAFSGRRGFPRPNAAMANQFLSRASDGLCFDFSGVDAHTDAVPVFSIGAVKNHTDARRFVDDAKQRSPSGIANLRASGDSWEW